MVRKNIFLSKMVLRAIAKKKINWLTNTKVKLIENWPANSLDLSCIEQVWAILEAKILKYRFF